MREIVVISGPPGVGKTTVCRHLSSLLPGTVSIEGDAIRTFAPGDAASHLGGGSTYRAGAALANAYVEMGAPRVLFEYIFLRPANLEAFRGLTGEIPLHLVTLWAPLEVVEAREQGRTGRARLGHAVRDCYSEIEANRGELGLFLTTADLSAESVADRLHNLVAQGAARFPPAAA